MPQDDQVTFPPEPVRPSSSGRSLAVRMGIVAGSAVLFVVGAVAAMGASPAPAASTAPDQGTDPAASVAPAASAAPAAPAASAAPAAPAASAAPKTTDPNNGTRPGGGKWMGPMGGMRGGLGFGGAPGIHGFGDITITGISGSDVSLKTDDGWTRTIAVTSDTKITKGSQTIGVADLQVGDHVVFAQTRNDDGTYAVTAIRVVLPTLGGQVSAIDGSTITVTQPGGTTARIHVSDKTTITVDGKTGATLSDIKVGSFVIAEGTQQNDGSLDAATLHSGFGANGKFGPGRPHDGAGKPAAPNASPAPSTSAG